MLLYPDKALVVVSNFCIFFPMYLTFRGIPYCVLAYFLLFFIVFLFILMF